MHSAHIRRYGPWALVTGASDGIGKAMADELAGAGIHLAVVARREERLESLAQGWRARGVKVRVLPADLSDPVQVDRVLRAVADVDVGLLVASAGFGTSGPWMESDLQAELGMVDVNCRAVLHLVHGLGLRMARRGSGGIVLLSSIVAFQGVPRAAHYAATKAYVQSLAEGLGPELRAHGVDVLASAPAPVHSGFASRANMQLGAALKPAVVARSTLRALGRRRTVRPGGLSKLLEAGLCLLPRSLRVRVLTQVMRGMTRHQLPAPVPTRG